MGNCKSLVTNVADGLRPHLSTCSENENGVDTKYKAKTYEKLPSNYETFRVIKVYDGDTMTLEGGTRVRLIGIDTPEIKEKQPYALEAKQLLSDNCLNQSVYLTYEGVSNDNNKANNHRNNDNNGNKDRYGRLLAWVWVKCHNGYLNVNEELVATGLASVYNPQKIAFQNYNEIIAYQKVAREKKKGKWDTYRNKKVLKTRNGRCYHNNSGCSYLSKTKSKNLISVMQSDALDIGLSPCRGCY